MRFIGREREIITLQRQFDSEKFEFTVIYGRRRVGKTYLIQKCIEGRNAIYFMAYETSRELNLERLSAQVNTWLGRSDVTPPYASYDDLFADIARIAAEQTLILVIDEYPYLAESTPEISSIIQKFCDFDWTDTKLKLVLCGSSMSFMQEQVLGAKSPLYGRRTAQLKISPFTFFETKENLGMMDIRSTFILHAATGGIPEYQNYIDTEKDASDNLVRLFLQPDGRLYEEPGNLLKQEMTNPKTYNVILSAIASGASKYNEIATKAQLTSGALTIYVERLIELGIVIKEMPIDQPRGRKTVYRISDGMFRFWHRFVSPYQSLLQMGMGEQVYAQYVQDRLDDFMGQGFESIGYDVFDRMNHDGLLPELYFSRGRWWGNNPIKKREEEIDLIALGKESTIYGEIKWRRQSITESVMEDLKEKSMVFRGKKPYYLLITSGSFTEEMHRIAKRDGVILIGREEIVAMK